MPGDLLYTNDHEWLRQEGDGIVVVGITEHAATALGRVGAAEATTALIEALEDGEARVREHVATALDVVGLADRAKHYPRQLSGGEQQRIAIARAIAPGPKILFADEPTGNLDQHTGTQIIELLLNLRKQIGVALVLVTHDAALAAQCDRRLLLDQGRLEPLA